MIGFKEAAIVIIKYVFIEEKTGTGFFAYAKDENINVGTAGKKTFLKI